MQKCLSILGSTGSIGQSTLKVIRHLKGRFKIGALAAHSRIDLLEEQCREFHPEIVAVYDGKAALSLKKKMPSLTVLSGIDGLKEVATFHQTQLVVSAISGTMGLLPTIDAICAGKDIALANKEVLVSGGSYVMKLVKEKKVKLLPVDSEHSALFQCLQGNTIESVNRLILTASGGPFRNYTGENLAAVSLEDALNHPNWKMGPKVTIDSSTLMNKGLEVIEASWLFNMPLEKIDVVVHPQSIIHSLVEYIDGSIMAQMGNPDMVLPIQYALTFPSRQAGLMKPFDFIQLGKLEFERPDLKRFRCLDLAFQAIKTGGSLACYMNAANEVLVNRFINREISWQQIAHGLETLMLRHSVRPLISIDGILDIDREARREAADLRE